MWDSDNDTGEIQKDTWEVEEDVFKIKLSIDDHVDEIVADHLADKHPNWCQSFDGAGVETEVETFIYVHVNKETGQVRVVGINGYPIDYNQSI